MSERRDFDKLLEASSLSRDSLWVECPTHGHQARDPYTSECVLCSPPHFVCPRCGAVSHNRTDVAEGYCGRCHDWTGS